MSVFPIFSLRYQRDPSQPHIYILYSKHTPWHIEYIERSFLPRSSIAAESVIVERRLLDSTYYARTAGAYHYVCPEKSKQPFFGC